MLTEIDTLFRLRNGRSGLLKSASRLLGRKTFTPSYVTSRSKAGRETIRSREAARRLETDEMRDAASVVENPLLSVSSSSPYFFELVISKVAHSGSAAFIWRAPRVGVAHDVAAAVDVEREAALGDGGAQLVQHGGQPPRQLELVDGVARLAVRQEEHVRRRVRAQVRAGELDELHQLLERRLQHGPAPAGWPTASSSFRSSEADIGKSANGTGLNAAASAARAAAPGS